MMDDVGYALDEPLYAAVRGSIRDQCQQCRAEITLSLPMQEAKRRGLSFLCQDCYEAHYDLADKVYQLYIIEDGKILDKLSTSQICGVYGEAVESCRNTVVFIGKDRVAVVMERSISTMAPVVLSLTS